MSSFCTKNPCTWRISLSNHSAAGLGQVESTVKVCVSSSTAGRILLTWPQPPPPPFAKEGAHGEHDSLGLARLPPHRPLLPRLPQLRSGLCSPRTIIPFSSLIRFRTRLFWSLVGCGARSLYPIHTGSGFAVGAWEGIRSSSAPAFHQTQLKIFL